MDFWWNTTRGAKVTVLFSANRYGTLIERKVVPESTHSGYLRSEIERTCIIRRLPYTKKKNCASPKLRAWSSTTDHMFFVTKKNSTKSLFLRPVKAHVLFFKLYYLEFFANFSIVDETLGNSINEFNIKCNIIFLIFYMT